MLTNFRIRHGQAQIAANRRNDLGISEDVDEVEDGSGGTVRRQLIAGFHSYLRPATSHNQKAGMRTRQMPARSEFPWRYLAAMSWPRATPPVFIALCTLK